MILLVAGVVGAVAAAFLLQATPVGQHAASAVCRIITLGQGGCSSPAAAQTDRAPKEACTVSSEQVSKSTEIAVLVVTARDGRSFEIAKQSDGSYKVTRVSTAAGGAEVGVGAGVTLTVNDNKYGGYAGADVGAQIEFNGGEVYVAKNDAELKALVDEEIEDTVEDTALGNGPFRWLWEGGQDVAGKITGNPDHEFGTPDEVYVEGGVVINASAEATALTDSASAGLGVSEALGVKTTKDGKTSIYLKSTAKGKAQLQSLGVDTDGIDFSGAGGSGELELLTEVVFDSSGNMVEVKTQSTAAGQSKGLVTGIFNGDYDDSLSNTTSGATVFQSSLKITNDQDRNTALSFLAASGVQQLSGPAIQLATIVPSANAMLEFQKAAADHGTVTQQHLTTQTNTVVGVDAAGKLGIELGLAADVSTKSMVSTGAEYWGRHAVAELGSLRRLRTTVRRGSRVLSSTATRQHHDPRQKGRTLSHPGQPSPPAARTGAGGTAGLVAKVAIGTAIGGLVMGLLSASVAVSSESSTVGIWIRGVLSLVVVLLICRIFGRRAQQSGTAQPIAVVGLGAFVGFLLNPLTWQARTALTQLLADPGAITLVGDLLLWMLASGIGAYLGAQSAPRRAPNTTPYG